MDGSSERGEIGLQDCDEQMMIPFAGGINLVLQVAKGPLAKLFHEMSRLQCYMKIPDRA
jgi:hypothetical protein